MRGIATKLIVSIVLLSTATVIAFLTPNKPGARANQTLTTTWRATQFINATSPSETDLKFPPISIGVTKWHNVTSDGATVVYDEDWSADVPASGTFKIRGYADLLVDYPPYLELPAGFDQNRLNSAWLYNGGGMWLTRDINRMIEYSFSATPSAYFGQRTTGSAKFEALGNSLQCYGGSTDNARCIYATGSYGFNVTGNLGDGNNETLDAFGAMIPTKWTVIGTIHD